ncbi:MAG: SEC-C metal-binding domain-containing protein, partial [Acidimicrobiales bacterium]
GGAGAAPGGGRGDGRGRQQAPPDDDTLVPTVKAPQEKVGRNDPCWCGSGKKYKLCHGAA